MKTAVVVAIALLAFGTPGVASQSAPANIAELDGSGARFDGKTVVSGALAFLSFVPPSSSSTDLAKEYLAGADGRIAPSSMTLHANQIAASTDYQRGGPTILADPMQPAATANRTFPGSVAVELEASRERFAIFVAPVGAGTQVTVQSGAAMIQAGSQGQIQSPAFVQGPGREPLLSKGGPNHAVVSPGRERTVTISGDFALTFWEMDLRVSHSGGTETLRTGLIFNSTVPTGEFNLVGSWEQRQTYVFVHDGTLSLKFDGQATAVVALKAEDAATSGRVTFMDATGTLQTPDGARSINGGDVTIEGADLAVAFGAITQDRFSATLSGNPDRAIVGGQVIPYPAASTVTPMGATPWLQAAGAAAVAGMGVAFFLVRRRRLGSDMAHLEALIDDGRYREAVVAARPALLQSRRHGEDAQVIRAVSLLRTGRLDEAKAALDSWHGAPTASLDYLWAFLHALQGESKAARERIHACLAKDAGMQADIESNPAFTPILKNPNTSRVPVVDAGGYS